MRPYFRCRHCKKRLILLVQSFAHYLWGRERICPRCGKIWRLSITSHQVLIGFGVIAAVFLSIVVRHWLPGPDVAILVLALWLPLYAFIVWPAIFALLGNFRLK
jgi:phage FluMu protein Com